MRDKIDLIESDDSGDLDSQLADLRERRRAIEVAMELLREEKVKNLHELRAYEADRILRAYWRDGLTGEILEDIRRHYEGGLYAYNPDDPGFSKDVLEGRALGAVQELGRVYRDTKAFRFDLVPGVALEGVAVWENVDIEGILTHINSLPRDYPRFIEWHPLGVRTIVVGDDGTKEITMDTVLDNGFREVTVADIAREMGNCRRG